MNLSANFSYKVMAAAAVLAVVGFYLVKKNGVVGVAADATSGAIGVLGDVAGGVVIGVGDVIGIPRTNETECEKAIREGRTWDASFACPAGTFIKSVFSW